MRYESSIYLIFFHYAVELVYWLIFLNNYVKNFFFVFAGNIDGCFACDRFPERMENSFSDNYGRGDLRRFFIVEEKYKFSAQNFERKGAYGDRFVCSKQSHRHLRQDEEISGRSQY